MLSNVFNRKKLPVKVYETTGTVISDINLTLAVGGMGFDQCFVATKGQEIKISVMKDKDASFIELHNPGYTACEVPMNAEGYPEYAKRAFFTSKEADRFHSLVDWNNKSELEGWLLKLKIPYPQISVQSI